MVPISSRTKGLRLREQIRDDVRKTFKLPESDVVARVSPTRGCDLLLSADARSRFPFGIVTSASNRFHWYMTYSRAKDLAESEGLTPVGVFKRTGEPAYVMLRWTDFLEIATKLDRLRRIEKDGS
jgi:hypothetical protein